MSASSKTMRPAVGRRTPVRQLKNVDFPAPLGPMMARISPRRTATDTLLSAASPPNCMDRPSVRRITGAAAPRPDATGAVDEAGSATYANLQAAGTIVLSFGITSTILYLPP